MILLLCFLLTTKNNALVPTSPTVVDQSLNLSNFQLAWFDDFNLSSTLDPNKWNIQTGFTSGGYSLASNVYIFNQNLYMRQSNESAGYYSQGRINSVPYFDYGFFEARIQFPNISGWHDSFWLVGLQTFGPPYYNVELDVAEVNTYNMYYFPQHFHYWTNGSSSQRMAVSNTTWKMNLNTVSPLHTWNIFGVQWNRTHVMTYLNGGRMLTANYPPNIVPNPVNILFTEFIWIDTRFPIINMTSYMIIDRVAYYRDLTISDGESLCAPFQNLTCIS